MILNGIPIKKYKAKVRNIIPMTTLAEPINTDEYRIFEGYVSIDSIGIRYDNGTANGMPEYHYVFISDEISYNKQYSSGFGVMLFAPIKYDEFEIIGEVEE